MAEWMYTNFPGTNGATDAVTFLNEAPRQGAGEVSAVARNDGSVGLFYFEPGSLGSGTQQTWQYRDFPGPNGPGDAVTFLNEPAAQNRGEASANARNDGSAGLFYLEPGTA